MQIDRIKNWNSSKMVQNKRVKKSRMIDWMTHVSLGFSHRNDRHRVKLEFWMCINMLSHWMFVSNKVIPVTPATVFLLFFSLVLLDNVAISLFDIWRLFARHRFDSISKLRWNAMEWQHSEGRIDPYQRRTYFYSSIVAFFRHKHNISFIPFTYFFIGFSF